MNEKSVDPPAPVPDTEDGGGVSEPLVIIEIDPGRPGTPARPLELPLPNHHVEPDSQWKRPQVDEQGKILHVDPDDPWRRTRRPGDDSEIA